MAKPKYSLEDLRKKCGPEKSNIGIGARQLEFVFTHYDLQKNRADQAEASLSGLQRGMHNMAIELERYAGCPLGVQIFPMNLVQCDSCAKKGAAVVECWMGYGRSFFSEAHHE